MHMWVFLCVFLWVWEFEVEHETARISKARLQSHIISSLFVDLS